jgi:hypothetical protein
MLSHKEAKDNTASQVSTVATAHKKSRRDRGSGWLPELPNTTQLISMGQDLSSGLPKLSCLWIKRVSAIFPKGEIESLKWKSVSPVTHQQKVGIRAKCFWCPALGSPSWARQRFLEVSGGRAGGVRGTALDLF